MRLVGVLLLACGTALWGIFAARRTNWRVRDLSMLSEGLRAMQRELSYRLAPLSELLCSAGRVSTGCVREFFSMCKCGVDRLNGSTFQAVWKDALRSSGVSLKQEDIQCLDALGTVLGRYDSESQQQALQVAISRLEELGQDARMQSGRLGKLYSVLGLTGGAFLLILLV